MKARLVLLALVALALPQRAHAQSCTATKFLGFFWFGCNINTTATMTVGTVMQLTLSGTTTTLTPPTVAGYTAGFMADNGPTATVRCNQAWHLQIASAATTWTATNTVAGITARPNKPSTDLQWSLAANGTFAGLTTTAVTVTNGTATAGTATNFFYHTLYGYAVDTPGKYTLAVVYTLISP